MPCFPFEKTTPTFRQTSETLKFPHTQIQKCSCNTTLALLDPQRLWPWPSWPGNGSCVPTWQPNPATPEKLRFWIIVTETAINIRRSAQGLAKGGRRPSVVSDLTYDHPICEFGLLAFGVHFATMDMWIQQVDLWPNLRLQSLGFPLRSSLFQSQQPSLFEILVHQINIYHSVNYSCTLIIEDLDSSLAICDVATRSELRITLWFITEDGFSPTMCEQPCDRMRGGGDWRAWAKGMVSMWTKQLATTTEATIYQRWLFSSGLVHKSPGKTKLPSSLLSKLGSSVRCTAPLPKTATMNPATTWVWMVGWFGDMRVTTEVDWHVVLFPFFIQLVHMLVARNQTTHVWMPNRMMGSSPNQPPRTNKLMAGRSKGLAARRSKYLGLLRIRDWLGRVRMYVRRAGKHIDTLLWRK